MVETVRMKLIESVYQRLHISSDDYKDADDYTKLLIQMRRIAVEAAVVVLDEYEELNR